MKQRINRKSPSIFIVEKVFKSKLKMKIYKLEFYTACAKSSHSIKLALTICFATIPAVRVGSFLQIRALWIAVRQLLVRENNCDYVCMEKMACYSSTGLFNTIILNKSSHISDCSLLERSSISLMSSGTAL
jgi:hypothetical protein